MKQKNGQGKFRPKLLPSPHHFSKNTTTTATLPHISDYQLITRGSCVAVWWLRLSYYILATTLCLQLATRSLKLKSRVLEKLSKRLYFCFFCGFDSMIYIDVDFNCGRCRLYPPKSKFQLRFLVGNRHFFAKDYHTATKPPRVTS